MNRINVLRESKFNKMTEVEMTHVKGGGICLSCLKRTRKWGLILTFNPNEYHDRLNMPQPYSWDPDYAEQPPSVYKTSEPEFYSPF